MPLYPSLIDTAIPIDAHARRRIHRAAWRRWNENPIKGITFGLLGILPLFIGAFLPRSPMTNQLGIPTLILAAITGMIYLFVLSLILRRFSYAPCVYAELRERGYDVCPKCGYWLRDLGDNVHACPECGKKRTPLRSQ